MTSQFDAGKADAVPAVAELLRDLSSEIGTHRERAVERLRQVEDPEPLLRPLAEALRDPADATRRNAARSAFAALSSPEAQGGETARGAVETLLRADPDADVRLLAASALGESGNPAALDALREALEDPETNVVAAAADALGVLGVRDAVPSLCACAAEGDFWSRTAAIVALGRLEDATAVPTLDAAVGETALAGVAADALGAIGAPAGLDALRPLLANQDPELRRIAQTAAARILTANPHVAAPAWLSAVLRERVEELGTRLFSGDDCAARLLGVAGTAAAAESLIGALSQHEVCSAAAAGLGLLPATLTLPLVLPRLPEMEPDERAAVLTVLPGLPPTAALADIRLLAGFLGDEHSDTRFAAAALLGRSDGDAVLPVLHEAAESPRTRRGAAAALVQQPAAPRQLLVSLLNDPDPEIRRAVAHGLATRDDVGTLREPLLAALDTEQDARARRAMIGALGATGYADVVSVLRRWAESPDMATRYTAVRALGRTATPAALEPLLDALGEADPGVRAAAIHALGQLGEPRAAEPVAAQLDAEDRDLRRVAASALRALAPPAATDRLVAALKDVDREVRLVAARTLSRLGSRRALEPLGERAAQDPDPLVRTEAARAAEVIKADLPPAADDSL